MPRTLKFADRIRAADAAGAPSDEIVLSWSIHRLRQSPSKLIFIVPCVLLVGLAGAAVFHSVLYGLVAALALCLAIGDYLLPVTFTLTTQSAQSSCGLSTSRIQLSDVRKVLVSANDIRLSPLSRRSRLDAFRGVRLICDGNHEQVMAALDELGTLRASRGGRARRP